MYRKQMKPVLSSHTDTQPEMERRYRHHINLGWRRNTKRFDRRTARRHARNIIAEGVREFNEAAYDDSTQAQAEENQLNFELAMEYEAAEEARKYYDNLHNLHDEYIDGYGICDGCGHWTEDCVCAEGNHMRDFVTVRCPHCGHEHINWRE